MANDLNKGSVTYAENRREFLESLESFHVARGTPFPRVPKIGGRTIDLYHLYRRVVDLGGWKKVNQLMHWDNILEEFSIPEACPNGQQILQYVYIRYLKTYEMVKFWGQDPDDDMGVHSNGHARKRVFLPLESIPLSYNYSQHQVSDAERKTNMLSTDLARHGDFDKLEMSLRSGLANEVDFALNVCLLLSAQDKEFLRLNKTRHLLSLLMATVGVFDQGSASMKDVMLYNWNSGESKRDYAKFWLDVVKDKQIRESLRTESGTCTEEEQLGSEVLSCNREPNAKDVEGQRATQIAMLIRNFSIEDINHQLLASNHLVFRFLMQCVHSSYGSLRHLALDTLGNIAIQMVLEPTTNPSTQSVMNLIKESLMDDDKFAVVRALEMLSKLCQVEDNEPVLNRSLEEGTYCRMVQLLMVHNVHIIIQSLEALYQLSAVGESTATKIAHVRSAVDILVRLVTVDVQSFGPDAQQNMRVVECVAADMDSTAAAAAADGGGRLASLPASYFVETSAAAATCVPVPAEEAKQPSAEPVTVKSVTAEVETLASDPVTSKKVTPEVEILVSNWLSSTYEINAGSFVPHTELYAEYQEMCRKRRITRLLSVPDLAAIVKTVLPEVTVAEVDKGGGGGKETVFKGLCKCPQPRPFTIMTSSGAITADPSAAGVSSAQTCRPRTVILPSPSLQVTHSGLTVPSTVTCHAAATTATCHTVAASCQTATCHAVTVKCHTSTATRHTTAATLHAAAATSYAASVACQTAFPAVMTGPLDQMPGRAGAQPSQTSTFSTLHAVMPKMQIHHHHHATSALKQQQQTQPAAAASTSKITACSQQQTGKVSVSSSSSLTSSQSVSNGTRTSSTVVSAGTSTTVSSSSEMSSTWITIPCAPWQKTQPPAQKAGKKAAAGSKGQQDSDVIKTLLAKKVTQQRVCPGSTASSPSPPLQSSSPASAASASTLQHPELVSKLQQHLQSPQSQHLQQQSQSQLPANQPVVWTQQTLSGHSQVQLTHPQQALLSQTNQPAVAWNAPQAVQLQVGGQSQTVLVRQASPAPVQPQAVALNQQLTPASQLQQQQQAVTQLTQTLQLQQQQQQPVTPQLTQTLQLQQQQQQPVTPQLTQTLQLQQQQQQPVTPQLTQTLQLQQQQQPVTPQLTQTLQLQPQQQPVTPQLTQTLQLQQQQQAVPQLTQTSQTLQLQQQQQQAGTSASQATPTPAQSSQQETLPQQQAAAVGQQSSQVCSQTPTTTPQPQSALLLRQLMTASPPMVVRPGLTQLSQPSSTPVQLSLQGSQQIAQSTGQPHVLQQILRLQGQQFVVRQPLPRQHVPIQPRVLGGQPQTVAQPAPGQIVMRSPHQPVQIGPQRQFIVQQGQLRQVIVQGQLGLQHILQQPLQQPLQQLHFQGQGQGQVVRIQPPMTVQLPINAWSPIASSQSVGVGSSSNNALPATSLDPLSAGSSSQGASTSYRAIIPRPPSNPPAQCSQKLEDSAPGPMGSRQQAPDSKHHLHVAKTGSTEVASHQGLDVKTEVAGEAVPSASQSVDSASRVHGTSADMTQVAATSVQAFAPSVSKVSGMSSHQSSASSCSTAVSLTTSLSSQHSTPTVQSSCKSVPSIQNVIKSENGSPASSTPSDGCTAKYNGFVNGTKLHKEGIYNGAHLDVAASSPSVGKGKVNGVLGSSKSSSSCPLMSLDIKKEFVNGVGERCVPLQPDLLTGCSKEWLKNLPISQDRPGQSSHNPIEIDDFPLQTHTDGMESGEGSKTKQKTSVWQRNGLISHAGTNEASASVFDHHPALVRGGSVSEHSLDSVDSSHSGSQPVLCSTGSQVSSQTCNGGGSYVADGINAQGVPKNYFFRTRKRSRSFRQLHEGVGAWSSSSESESESTDVPAVRVFVKQTVKRKVVVPKPPKEAPPSKKKKIITPPSRPGLTMPREIKYMCEWAKCGRLFTTADRVLVHAVKDHVSSSPEFVCQWEGCQPLKRKKLSLVTHLQDHHCSEAKQRKAFERRFLMSHKAIIPQVPQPPLMVYPDDAAQQAIQRFHRQPPFVEFSAEKECPLTKHIRLTSALTLRNIARYSAFGRRLIRRKEEELSYVVMSEVESSSALASCLWELLQDA